MHRKTRVIRFHASRNKNVFFLATKSVSQLAGYQILTTEAKARGSVCHRKSYLLTKGKIYDTIDNEPEIEQRNM